MTQAASEGGQGLTYAWLQIARQMLPSNPFAAMAEGQPLGMIMFAIVLGVALALSGDVGDPAVRVLNGINEALLRAVGWVLWIIPVGAFLLVSASVGKVGLGHPVRWFCYPVGRHDATSANAVDAAGYLLAYTTDAGSTLRSDQRAVLPRVRVSGGQSLSSFAASMTAASA